MIARKLCDFRQFCLRLAGVPGEIWPDQHAEPISPMSPASSTPTAATTTTGASRRRTAPSQAVTVSGPIEVNSARMRLDARRDCRPRRRADPGFRRQAEDRVRRTGHHSRRLSSPRTAASMPSIRTAATCRPRCGASSTSSWLVQEERAEQQCRSPDRLMAASGISTHSGKSAQAEFQGSSTTC